MINQIKYTKEQLLNALKSTISNFDNYSNTTIEQLCKISALEYFNVFYQKEYMISDTLKLSYLLIHSALKDLKLFGSLSFLSNKDRAEQIISFYNNQFSLNRTNDMYLKESENGFAIILSRTVVSCERNNKSTYISELEFNNTNTCELNLSNPVFIVKQNKSSPNRTENTFNLNINIKNIKFIPFLKMINHECNKQSINKIKAVELEINDKIHFILRKIQDPSVI
jgi:hypothetical protein